jgi:hypothetical protein
MYWGLQVGDGGVTVRLMRAASDLPAEEAVPEPAGAYDPVEQTRRQRQVDADRIAAAMLENRLDCLSVYQAAKLMSESHPTHTPRQRTSLFSSLVSAGLFKLTSKSKHGDSRYVPVIQTMQTAEALYPAGPANLAVEFPESFQIQALRDYMMPDGPRSRNVSILS